MEKRIAIVTGVLRLKGLGKQSVQKWLLMELIFSLPIGGHIIPEQN